MAKTLPNSGMVIPEIGDGPADVTKLTDALTTLDSVIGTLKTNISLLETAFIYRGILPADRTSLKTGFYVYGGGTSPSYAWLPEASYGMMICFANTYKTQVFVRGPMGAAWISFAPENDSYSAWVRLNLS